MLSAIGSINNKKELLASFLAHVQKVLVSNLNYRLKRNKIVALLWLLFAKIIAGSDRKKLQNFMPNFLKKKVSIYVIDHSPKKVLSNLRLSFTAFSFK